MIIDGTDEDVALDTHCFVEANEAYYFGQNDEIRIEYGEQQQQVCDHHHFANETGPSIGISDISVRPMDGNVYAVCEESTAVLPKYGRVRIIKSVRKMS